MSDDVKKSDNAFCGDLYRLIRIDTERFVTEILGQMRTRREQAVDQYLHERSAGPMKDTGPAVADGGSERLVEIEMSYSAGFAHALLQGAIDAFDDETEGLKLLKKLIDVELVEMEHNANFANQSTSAGSSAIN